MTKNGEDSFQRTGSMEIKSPCLLCVPKMKDMNREGKKKFGLHKMEEGMTKRFCTLHLVFRAEGTQPKPTIIFRGQGVRISRLERESWDARVIVMFQKKAWADRKFIIDHTKNNLCPFIRANLPPELEKVYFCDNLDSQLQQSFVDALKSVNCFRWLLPVKSTSETQPVDAGLGRLVKLLISQEFEVWLEHEDNLEIWENGKLSASEKRVLITKFVGAAWEKVFLSGKYNPAAFFEKTGCLLTLAVLKVRIEECLEYKPP